VTRTSRLPLPERLTEDRMRRNLEALRASFAHAEVISRRANRLVIRWREVDSGQTVVVKLWSRPDLRGAVRRTLRIAPCHREWRNLTRLMRQDVAVPRPLGLATVVPDIAGYTDALMMEDLGECETATEHLKRLLRAGDERGAQALEDAVIEITRRLVDAGMLDEDHGMLNVVVPRAGRPARLDVEIMRRVFVPALFIGSYGRMLGRLIGLHAFAVQPDVGRTLRFADRLRARLNPSRPVLWRATRHAHQMMAEQRRRYGIDTRLRLPWE
jgi:hypothetical protein